MTPEQYLTKLKTLIKLPQEYHDDDEQLLLLITPCTHHAIRYLTTKKEKENGIKAQHVEQALDIPEIQIVVAIMVRYHYDNQGQYMNTPEYPDIVYNMLYLITGSFKLN